MQTGQTRAGLACATFLSQISPANRVFHIANLLLTQGGLTGLTGSWIALAVFLAVALLAFGGCGRCAAAGCGARRRFG